MEIILKKDVDRLGYKNDLVKVKNGYARNYLIPKGMAILATVSAKKVLAENVKQRAHKEAKIIGEVEELALQLAKLDLKVEEKSCRRPQAREPNGE